MPDTAQHPICSRDEESFEKGPRRPEASTISAADAGLPNDLWTPATFRVSWSKYGSGPKRCVARRSARSFLNALLSLNVGTSASLLVTGALLVVTRSY